MAAKDKPQAPETLVKGLSADFDPTAELWERLVDDIVDKGAPCMDTVEQLLDEACRQPAKAPQKPEAE